MTKSSQSRFVIQKHEAVDFHYVLRLEVGDGVRSWAVPKGPSPDPRVKRLAIPVDYDMEMDFEGVIDRSQGPDRVIVWDSGEYRPFDLDGDPISVTESLEEGRLDLWLSGQKLEGGFTLLRVDEGRDERWMLIKSNDEKATSRRDPVVTEPLSVISGRNVEDVDK
ncbi:MAG: DNA polymerase ligase N-terminal domain-containing protein [bacterium]